MGQREQSTKAHGPPPCAQPWAYLMLTELDSLIPTVVVGGLRRIYKNVAEKAAKYHNPCLGGYYD